jgi:hypothetical protein
VRRPTNYSKHGRGLRFDLSSPRQPILACQFPLHPFPWRKIFVQRKSERIPLLEGLRAVPEELVDVCFRFYLVDVVACVEVPLLPDVNDGAVLLGVRRVGNQEQQHGNDALYGAADWRRGNFGTQIGSERYVNRILRSGKSVAAFCREQKLRASHFYWWKKRLQENPTARFVEVQVAESPANVAGDSRIEVLLQNGRRLMVGRGFDPEHVRGLLAVVEAAG